MPVAKLKKNRSKDSETMAAVAVLEAVKNQSEESQAGTRPSDADLRLMVAEAAYYRALARGFEGGHADEDWYAAETEIKQAYL